MYRDKTEYELAYWRGKTTSPQEAKGKYLAYLKLFSTNIAELAELDVMDVGCGPNCGVLPLLPGTGRRVAVDPLWGRYIQEGLANIPLGVEAIECCAEDTAPFAAQMDVVFCTNALDHHPEQGKDTVAISLQRMAQCLRPGGYLCLLVHLRRKEQLDFGHDVAVAETTVLAGLGSLVRVEWATVGPNDPVGGGPWSTLILRGVRQ